MDEDLAAWGKVVVLETTGRRSGQPRRAAVGFVREQDGSLVVAASTPETQWALNLRAEAHCFAELEGARLACRADLLGEPERRAAVAALILKYGTPAERLGQGPAFRLVPAGRSTSAAGR
jgi:deazaflavin-dependent oxidoreductase (nitroreductase family)